MRKSIVALLTSLTTLWTGSGRAASQPAEAGLPASLYEVPVTTLAGADTTLASYRGDVLLIVNVASRCGFTGQYEGLQKLQTDYGARGLSVLGFPANNFLNQEPGTNEEIASFCSVRFGVTFPMFAKISVKGGDQHPLYRYLTSPSTNPEHAGEIEWNFTKFLVGRDGRVIDRFGPRTKPEDEKVIAAIEQALAEAPPAP